MPQFHLVFNDNGPYVFVDSSAANSVRQLRIEVTDTPSSPFTRIELDLWHNDPVQLGYDIALLETLEPDPTLGEIIINDLGTGPVV